MIQPNDIHSLTDFVRHTREHAERLEQTGRPEVLTVNGSAKLVIQSTDGYEKLLQRLEQLESLEALRYGLESMNEGRGRPAAEVLDEIRRQFNIPKET